MKFDMAQAYTSMSASLAIKGIRPVLDNTDDDGTIPATLREWLLQMRLLQSIPFAYLVADSALLPEESIRWFYIDRRWTDATVMGALSVGTVNSDDRLHLAAQYEAIRDELDTEERNQRSHPNDPHLEGDGGPISGFVLRSKAVSGWPAMHVRAYDTDPTGDLRQEPAPDTEIRLLRLERLAPAVLLALFDGIPRMVILEEPRQGIQFGVDDGDPGPGFTAQIVPRDKSTFADITGQKLPVRFRRGGSGVVNIKAFQQGLTTWPQTGATDGLDSAEFALQMVRPPYRQIWGEQQEPTVGTMFTATIAYQTMVSAAFMKVEP